MARKKKGGGEHGGHGWFVTFADLMALLMSFFVMIAAYSTQDQKKLQLVAGSMRDAFGVSKESRYAGIVEQDGIPVRDKLRHARITSPDQATDRPGPPQEGDIDGAPPGRSAKDKGFLVATATLRQALQDMPDIAEVSKNVILEDTPEGLNLAIIDQDGRAMFARGSTAPFERTRTLLERLAPTFRQLPQRVTITGHTAANRPGETPEGPPWDLSAGRATVVRDLLSGAGVPSDRFAGIGGKADVEPMFPDNPYLAANRRVTITLMREAPALPADMKPY